MALHPRRRPELGAAPQPPPRPARRGHRHQPGRRPGPNRRHRTRRAGWCTGPCRVLGARLHSPIGLDPGGSEPAEIALAILAELVAVRLDADGGSLSAHVELRTAWSPRSAAFFASKACAQSIAIANFGSMSAPCAAAPGVIDGWAATAAHRASRAAGMAVARGPRVLESGVRSSATPAILSSLGGSQ